MELSKELRRAIEMLRNAQLDAREGLTQELFLLISSLMPVPNVDLLIVNERNQLLLARRNDVFFEKSWHIPGGCMRYGESFAQAVQRTARRELGCRVTLDPVPLAVRNVLRGENPQQLYPRERGHNVAILYRCRLPMDYRIENNGKTMDENGYLQWFDRLPEDFMKIQHVYDDILTSWREEVAYGCMEK